MSPAAIPDHNRHMGQNSIRIANAVPISNAKALIDGISALQKVDIPEYLMKQGAIRKGSEFDPNTYFSVLKHISVIPHHTLDYVYSYQSTGGQPILYVRRVDAVPFQYPGQVSSWNRRNDIYDCLLADGSPQSFFELVVFRLMASQFYQFWHAGYNDQRIMTSQNDIEKLISGINGSVRSAKFTEQQMAAMRAFDVQPQVKMSDTEAAVFYCVFSSWGGLSRQKTAYRLAPPHRILGEITMAKVNYDCGFCY